MTRRARVHGPALLSQYNRFRSNQWRPITEEIAKPTVPPEVDAHLRETLGVFGPETAYALEQMTHAERPWLDARGNLPPHALSENIIPKRSMQEFYASL